MAQVLIRNLDPDLLDWLKRRAAKAGTSLEQYLRDLLAEAQRADAEDALGVAHAIRARAKPAHRSAEELIREDRDHGHGRL